MEKLIPCTRQNLLLSWHPTAQSNILHGEILINITHNNILSYEQLGPNCPIIKLFNYSTA